MIETKVLNGVTPNEFYVGAQEEITQIRRWLEDQRRVPITTDFMRLHVAKLRQLSEVPLLDIHNLDSILRAESPVIDVDLFRRASSELDERLQSISDQATVLNPKRYFIGVLDHQTGGTGGFFSRYSMGFQYLSFFGFSNLLTEKATTNPLIVTFDLIRNYLHDSLHATTYRSFAKKPGDSSGEPVYRYQYGLNFRTPDGKSYSAPSLTEQHSPYAINLNLLMDGLIMLDVADQLRKIWESNPDKPKLSSLEQEILDGIIDPAGNGAVGNVLGHNFNRNVARRTQEFLQYWNLENNGQLRDMLFEAMITGKLGAAKAYFEQVLPKALAREEQQFSAGQLQRRALFEYLTDRKQYGNAWEQIFRSPDWKDPLQKA